MARSPDGDGSVVSLNGVTMGKIRVENLYKIFGNKPNKALGMLKDGHDKQSVLDKPA